MAVVRSRVRCGLLAVAAAFWGPVDLNPARAEGLLPPEHPGPQVIDQYIAARQRSAQVRPAALVDDAQFIRRVTLDLAGRIPTLAEWQTYAAASDPEKKPLLVDRLLQSPDFAFHQRNWLDAMLLPMRRNEGRWREYLLAAARENRPWDRMFQEMLLGRDDDPKQEGALTFLKVRARDLDDLTNDTSRLFFGVSINCAKCHDHPLVADWEQKHYFGFSAFFSRTYLTKKNLLAEKHTGEVKYKTTSGEEHLAPVMFLTGTEIPEPNVERTAEELKRLEEEVKRQMKDDNAPPPSPPEFSLRQKLVEIALREGENHFFARSIVNRVWARFFGRGLVHPLDQMHSENPASHPELLEWLTRDLIAHRYDLKRLIRHVVLSDAYARSSRWEEPAERPAEDAFAVAVPRVLSPWQYALSLMIATADPESFPADLAPEDWARRREQLEHQSAGLAAQIELPAEHFQVSVDEALLFNNSDRIANEFLRDAPDRLVGRLKQIDDRRDVIETAFRAVLSRPPADDEAAAAEQFLQQRDDRRDEGIRQLVWALMTSPELRFNY